MMKRRLMLSALIVIVAAAGAQALAAGIKLPKCNTVDCRGLGCPADVLCVSGAHVKTCADICGGH